VATLVGCALAWSGLVISSLKPLYDYAWFVGFFTSAIVYVLLRPADAPAIERPDTSSLKGTVRSVRL
jgi:NCS1 family nucleobase:cation symporter-1